MSSLRPAWCEIDLAAICANARTLAERARPAELMAVVKADGYGHGAVQAARAALDGGATWLGVALVGEGVELRDAGLDGPVLVLSEPVPEAAHAVVDAHLTPVVYTNRGVEALAKAVADTGAARLPVHLKVDTGMHRVGCSTDEAVALARSITQRSELQLEGVLTHLAVADEPGNPYTDEQLDRFDATLAAIRRAGMTPSIVHASNSAGLLAVTRARYDLVRAGIALYGIPPSDALRGVVDLHPALSLHARVSHVKRVPVGARVSYGLRYAVEGGSWLATVPLGYADGVPRNYGLRGGEVLVGGRRRPVAGTVTMDQLLVDCGSDEVAVGDEVVLIGRQGAEELGAEEWARRLETIAYEVVCGVGPRVPKVHRG